MKSIHILKILTILKMLNFKTNKKIMTIDSTILEFILAEDLEFTIEEYPSEFEHLENVNVKDYIGWTATSKNKKYDSEKGSVELDITIKDSSGQKYKAYCPYFTAVGGYDWDSSDVELVKK